MCDLKVYQFLFDVKIGKKSAGNVVEKSYREVTSTFYAWARLSL